MCISPQNEQAKKRDVYLPNTNALRQWLHDHDSISMYVSVVGFLGNFRGFAFSTFLGPTNKAQNIESEKVHRTLSPNRTKRKITEFTSHRSKRSTNLMCTLHTNKHMRMYESRIAPVITPNELTNIGTQREKKPCRIEKKLAHSEICDAIRANTLLFCGPQ